MVGGFSLFFSLLNNLFLFIALVALYGYLRARIDEIGAIRQQLVLGLLFGVFAIGCMYARIPVYEGVIVDQRNAIIALSGAFGGPLSALISAVMAGGFRVYLGGGGVLAGVIGVFLAGLSGIIIRRLPFFFQTVARGVLSSLIAVIIILPGFLLVGDLSTGWNLMKAMALPYGTAILLGILLVGLLLQRQDERLAYKKSSLYSADLETANRNLRKTLDDLEFTRDRLVESRKMEALGGLVAGIAHEINTPLGIGITASSHLRDETIRFRQRFTDGEAGDEEVTEHLDGMLVMSEKVLSSQMRVSRLVADFKLLSAKNRSELSRRFNLYEFLGAIVSTFRKQLADSTCRISLAGEENLEVESYPGALAQILTQLIENSVIHGFGKSKNGRIDIAVSRSGDDILIRYSDDGAGMDATTSARAFEPFFTTRRTSGSVGLGLSIIFNLVTQQLKGRMDLDSESGKGTRISIFIPLTPSG